MNVSSARSTPVLLPSSAPVMRAERLVSLDVFRGVTMFWLLGGKAFVVALAGFAGARVIQSQFEHSAWEGVRYYDVIWPCFMLMVGVAVPFSFAHRATTQTRAEILRNAWKRAAVLFLLGSLRESLHDGVPRLIELSSALQPIAVAYLVASHLAGCAVRIQVAVTTALLVGYALLLAWVPAPGIPAGTYDINRNLVTAVDKLVLGRAHPDGWGTVLTTLPTIATTMIGLLLGRTLTSGVSAKAKLKVIALTGLGCLAAGYALSPVVPVIMKLWTTSYGLISAGWACLLFAAFFWAIDVQGWRRGTWALVVIGANALAAYLLPTLVPFRKIAGVFTAPLAKQLGAAGPVLTTGAALLLGWAILAWMYRRKIFLRG